MAWCHRHSLLVGLVLLALVVAPGVSNAYDIPNQVMTSLTFDLHSVDDEVDLYIGDPQSLFLMYVRPQTSLPPRMEFTNKAQVGVLRVRDLSLFEEPPLPEEETEEGAAEPETRVVEQEWRIQITPSAPASLVLHCVRGKARYDLSSIDVREFYLVADTAQVRVDFDRPNRVTLERFKVTSNGGSLNLRHFLNAHAVTTTLSVHEARCDLDLTGEPLGIMAVFVEGVASEMKLKLRRDVALQVLGPSPNVLRFDRDDFERAGTGLQTPHFVDQPDRLSLHFSHVIPRLEVEWVE